MKEDRAKVVSRNENCPDQDRVTEENIVNRYIFRQVKKFMGWQVHQETRE